MSRILLIGNSHLAAFRTGWDTIRAANPDVSIDFFAQPGPEYYHMTLNRKLSQFGAINEARFTQQQLERLDKFNGKRIVSLDGYDRIMVVGNQHGMADVLKLVAHRDVVGLRDTGSAHFLSRPAFDAVVDDIAASFMPHPAWERFSATPVTFHAIPRPAETAFDKVDRDSNVGRTYAKIEACADGIKTALDQLADVFTHHMDAIGLRFLQQPQDTMNAIGFTNAHMNTELESFTGHSMPAKDFQHMNASYGAACLCAAYPDILPSRDAA